MTVKLASLKADLTREEKGDWIEFPDWPGVEFNVSSLHLPAYRTQRELLMQRLGRKYKKKPVPPNVMLVELGKLYHEHLLHGWRGLDVEYEKTTAADIMTNPEYRNVISAVEWCAAAVSEIQVEYDEEEAGNSEQPSETA
jgi:hypothetical protein